MSENNRRRFERFPFYESVAYQRKEDSPSEGSLSEDISQRGLKLNVNEFIPLNTVLELQVRLPTQSQFVAVHAKVVWVRESPKYLDGWQVGMELLEEQTSLFEIDRYIKLQQYKAI